MFKYRWTLLGGLLFSTTLAGCSNPKSDTPQAQAKPAVEAAPAEVQVAAANEAPEIEVIPPAPPELTVKATASDEPATKSDEPAELPLSATPLEPLPIAPSVANDASAQVAQVKAVAEGEVPPVFVGWAKPKLALVLTGELDGYIEPCGCAGIENMKGGLGRRHEMFKDLAGRGWPLAAVDVGGQIKRSGPQEEIKFQSVLGALKSLQYAGVGFGAKDLRLPAGDLVSLVSDQGSPMVSANVGLFGVDSGITPKYRVVEAGGKKLGITSILGETYQKKVDNKEVEFAPAETALKEVVAKLKKEADFLILLSHATPAESMALARKFPEFHLVVTAGGGDEPPAAPRELEGSKTLIVEVGHKGMFMCVLGLFDDKDKPWRFQRVPLDKRYKGTPEMKQVMANYQEHLQLRGFENLGLKPTAHASGNKFVGSKSCADCHTKATQVWENTPHSHALDTLVKLEPARHYDPECLSCHVVGWRPQAFDAFTSGYLSLEKTAHLQHVGCENCHGPGSAHVAAENGDVKLDDAGMKKLRQQMVLKLEAAERTCLECHDLDNSPKFDFKEYWKTIEHVGKD